MAQAAFEFSPVVVSAVDAAATPAAGEDHTGFAIGWDHAHHRVTPPLCHLASGNPVGQGWLAGRAAFGERLSRLPISSGKAMLGHTLCASGAMGAVFTTLALLDGLLPPTMRHTEDDPELGIDCVPNAARPAALATAMTNSFAFGGLNAVLVQAR